MTSMTTTKVMEAMYMAKRKGGMKDFGKKNKGGNLDLPTDLGSPKGLKKRLKRKTPEQY